MGQVLKIENDETAALAVELAALMGESLDETVAESLRLRIASTRREQAEREKARKALADFHDLLDNPRPGSDHRWMYDDETGLPIW